MKKKRIWGILGLLVGLIAVIFLAYTFWPAGTEDRPTLMYFRADLWVYCKEMSPIVNGFKRKYRGRLNVIYVEMNREKGQELAKEYGVVGTPTLLFLDSEGNQVNMLHGAFPSSIIEQAIEDLLVLEKETASHSE